ncbi:MAG: hypothetical protein A2X86_02455 [Bdellovibrionales bacterium GWA2_49_15]|nr:MAG: hypothetical protein A2X86_02455 [Bdellovibrionales bacterium GWA2_49_15]
MFTVLLVETNGAVIDALVKQLDEQIKAQVSVVPGLDQAKSFLTENQGKGVPDLVIVRAVLDEVPVAHGLLNFVYEQLNRPPVIVMGNVEFSGIEFNCLPDRFKISEFSKIVTKALHVSRKELEALHRPPYTGISIKNFYGMDKCECDVFIRISKKNCDDQYVKRLHTGDNFDAVTLQKYESMGLLEFYVRSDDLSLVLSAFEQKALKQLDEKCVVAELVQIGSHQFEVGQDLLLKLGVSDVTMRIVDTNIKVMTNALVSGVVAPHNFGELLKALLANKGGYNYKHSFLLAFLCSTIIPKMEWGKNDQMKSNIEKMIYVSFMHDIHLQEEKLVRIHSKSAFEMMALTPQEHELVEYHANKVSTLALSMPRIPAGVDIILRQHHGTTNGVGFADGASGSLSGLAILFIVVETFTHMLLDFQVLQLGPKAILKKMERDYTLASYRKVIDAMAEMLKV